MLALPLLAALALGRQFVVVAGVEDYPLTSGYKPLKGAKNSASRVARALSGLPGVVVKDLYTHSPARKELLDGVRAFAAKAGPNDSVWFYFYGHGVKGRLGQGNSLLASFTDPAGMRAACVPIGDIHEAMRKCRAYRKVVVLDGCYTGTTRLTRSLGGVWSSLAAGSGYYLMAAAEANEPAQQLDYDDGTSEGLFTHVLLSVLARNPHIADLGALRRTVRSEVADIARSKHVQIQHPVFKVNRGGAWQDVEGGGFGLVARALPRSAILGVSAPKPRPARVAVVLRGDGGDRLTEAVARKMQTALRGRLAGTLDVFSPPPGATGWMGGPASVSAQYAASAADLLLRGEVSVEREDGPKTAGVATVGGTVTVRLELVDERGKLCWGRDLSDDLSHWVAPAAFPGAVKETAAGLLDRLEEEGLPKLDDLVGEPSEPTDGGKDSLCAAPPPKGRNLGVIVGVCDYPGKDDDLNGPITDAAQMGATLLDKRPGAFILADAPGTPAEYLCTKANILARLRKASAQARPQDTLWFYFSGHGLTLRGASFMVPHLLRDFRGEDDLIAVADIVAILRTSRAGRIVMGVDGCHSGSTEKARSRSWDAVIPERSFAFLAACQLDETALESQVGRDEKGRPVSMGMFTYFLVKGIRGEAAGSGGRVTFGSLSEYVKARVLERSPQQHPVFKLLRGSELYPVSPAPNAPPMIQGEILGEPIPYPGLKPGLMVVIRPSGTDEQEKITSGIARSTQTSLRGRLAREFPVYAPPFVAADSGDWQGAGRGIAVRLAKSGASLLLRGALTTDVEEIPLFASRPDVKQVRVTVTLEWELVDEEGKVAGGDTVVIGDDSGVVAATAAARRAREFAQDAVDEAYAQVREAVSRVLGTDKG